MSFMIHKLRELKRPSRLRSRIFFSLIFISSVILIVLGKWHAYKIQHSASQLGSYVPEKLAGAFAPYTIIENSEWDDTIPFPNNETNTNTDTNPKFHLVIRARKKSLNLCKTLLTASILNYPPPTLLGFKLKSDETEEKENEASALQEIQGMLDFLNGKDMQDDDLVLLLNANTWLQLPGEVIIERFLRNRREVNEKLREEYGVEKGIEAGTGMIRKLGQQKYTQKVLFAARKDCAVMDRGEREDVEEGKGESCYGDVIPRFPLLKDKGGKIDQYREYSRFIESSLAMGKVRDMKTLWSRAWEIAQERDGNGKEMKGCSMQEIMAQIFGEQEGRRVERRRVEDWRWMGWLGWLEGILGVSIVGKGRGRGGQESGGRNGNRTLGVGGNSERSDGEFGIGVDYTSGIFHTVGNSGEEVKVTTFSERKEKQIVSRRGVINGPVRDITMLSGEWGNIPRPLDLCGVPDIDKDADDEKEMSQSVKDLTAAREKNVSWDSIPLLTYSDGDGDGGSRGVNSNPRIPVSFSFGLGSDFDSDFGQSGKDKEKEKERNRKEEEASQKRIWEKTWWKTWGKQLWEECTKGVGEQRWVVGGDGKGKGRKGEGEGGRGTWIDGRGGRGGVWTGERVWIEWGEVCGGEVMDEIWGS
ncbi:hypothetical protein BTUL_0138g00300 [Botrytis tulipae]|uniref:Uncharacterized protein n=1 Tax=Botrytis tulipae TaxID=87230 RepID=A0A4Z1EIY9_9HELO|nr:hypothetical protein BTUL_0138g00300 [Botrytis tulipae]